jgi:peroxiredoxin
VWLIGLTAGLAFGGLAVYHLILQNGRLLLRVEVLEERLQGSRPQTRESHEDRVTIGGVLADFALPSLSGQTITLSQFRGRRLLLLFFSPRCSFCADMLPALEALPDSDSHPAVVIVTTGSAGENRRIFEPLRRQFPVLLQEEREVAALFGVHGTPMAYLVDENGLALSELTAGADAVLALACGTRTAVTEPQAGKPAKITRSLEGSRLLRNGLKAGTRAPDFTLPLIAGGNVSLSEFRGRPTLIVFSDPKCRPCDELAPQLQRLHIESSDVPIVMISRGDAESNRQKAKAFGLTFPVALQRHWEISKEYGIFATPVGYLVGEDGVLAADVALGADAITRLAATALGHRRLVVGAQA